MKKIIILGILLMSLSGCFVKDLFDRQSYIKKHEKEAVKLAIKYMKDKYDIKIKEKDVVNVDMNSRSTLAGEYYTSDFNGTADVLINYDNKEFEVFVNFEKNGKIRDDEKFILNEDGYDNYQKDIIVKDLENELATRLNLDKADFKMVMAEDMFFNTTMHDKYKNLETYIKNIGDKFGMIIITKKDVDEETIKKLKEDMNIYNLLFIKVNENGNISDFKLKYPRFTRMSDEYYSSFTNSMLFVEEYYFYKGEELDSEKYEVYHLYDNVYIKNKVKDDSLEPGLVIEKLEGEELNEIIGKYNSKCNDSGEVNSVYHISNEKGVSYEIYAHKSMINTSSYSPYINNLTVYSNENNCEMMGSLTVDGEYSYGSPLFNSGIKDEYVIITK